MVETETVKYWGTIATYLVDGETEVGICIVKKDSTVFESMERHVQTPEVMAPLEGDFVMPMVVSKNLEDPKENPKFHAIIAPYSHPNQ